MRKTRPKKSTAPSSKVSSVGPEIALDPQVCDNPLEVEKVPTRQREWQQRMQQEKRCIICGDEAVVSCYCEKHRDIRMRKLREKRGVDYQPQSCSVCGEEGHNKRTCPSYEAEHTFNRLLE